MELTYFLLVGIYTPDATQYGPLYYVHWFVAKACRSSVVRGEEPLEDSMLSKAALRCAIVLGDA